MKWINTPQFYRWLVKCLIKPGNVTIIHGPKGIGKTNLNASFGVASLVENQYLMTNIEYTEPLKDYYKVSKYSEAFRMGAKCLREERPATFCGDEVSLYANPKDTMTKSGRSFSKFMQVIRHLKMPFIGSTIDISATDKAIKNDLYGIIEIRLLKLGGNSVRRAYASIRSESLYNSWRDFYFDVAPCPVAYAGERFGTSFRCDVDVQQIIDAASDVAIKDIPDAIDANLDAQLDGKDDSFLYLEKHKVAAGLWLKGRNPDKTAVDIADMVGISDVTLRQAILRRKRKKEDANPPRSNHRDVKGLNSNELSIENQEDANDEAQATE